ncbi:MAG: hypothetical protein HQK64_10150, partial [Desulfamplus sp.]|nr:hypothetical protein [Desulfamplus sp.]
MKKSLRTILVTIIYLLIFTANAISGDSPSSINRTQQKDIPKLPDYLIEDGSTNTDKNKEYFNLPPVPDSRVPQAQGNAIFTLKGVLFEGNTLFSDKQLNEVAKKFINQEVSMADLEELR